MGDPVTVSVEIEELERARKTILDALHPKVVFRDDIEAMKEERDNIRCANLSSLLGWVQKYSRRD